jgi:hypothetical protein
LAKAKLENPYADQGIEVKGKKLSTGEKVSLIYSGLLAASGADRVFAHFGYGDAWECSELVEMTNNESGFETVIDLKMPGRLNICFKDSADNWDNNSNANYTFDISAKRAAGRKRKVVSE